MSTNFVLLAASQKVTSVGAKSKPPKNESLAFFHSEIHKKRSDPQSNLLRFESVCRTRSRVVFLPAFGSSPTGPSGFTLLQLHSAHRRDNRSKKTFPRFPHNPNKLNQWCKTKTKKTKVLPTPLPAPSCGVTSGWTTWSGLWPTGEPGGQERWSERGFVMMSSKQHKHRNGNTRYDGNRVFNMCWWRTWIKKNYYSESGAEEKMLYVFVYCFGSYF